MKKLLQVRGLQTYFPVLSPLLKRNRGCVKAVNEVSFDLAEGKILGIVGESGCGKTTLGRTIIRVLKPSAGKIIFLGRDITFDEGGSLKQVRKEMQMIFQDPYSSLNPKHNVKTILQEPLITYYPKILRTELEKKVEIVLNAVSLNKSDLKKFPHEFSGGQRQRIAIARALILTPKLIIADEPVSALDVSVQAQIINLLKKIKETFKVSFLFISHDLSVVSHIADEVIVMYLGKVVEIGSRENIFSNPLHPYSKKLIESIPSLDYKSKRKKIVMEGEIPSPYNPPSGCSFHTRCTFAKDICKTSAPVLKNYNKSHQVSCHLV